jgi:acetate CoA/acetoacetate CoA-transferase alpha subunit
MIMSKKIITAEAAVARVKDGDHIMVGGFLDGGNPQFIVRELIQQGQKDLTITSNDTGKIGCAIYDLMFTGRVKAVNASYIGANPETSRLMLSGESVVNLFPQGTLAEKIRAGGAGLGGVLTAVGLGTIVEEGKQKLEIDGKTYLLETPLRANVALVKANIADEFGNLVIRGSSKNFNTVMATAADYVIAEVDQVVKQGELDPEIITVPGLYIDAIVVGGESHGSA